MRAMGSCEQVFSQQEVDAFVERRLRLPFEKAVIRNRQNIDVEDPSKRKSERQYVPVDYRDPFIAKLTSYIAHISTTHYKRHNLWIARPWELLRYQQGDFFGRHCDKIDPNFGPFVSAVVYLGGEYEGGDVKLFHDQHTSDHTIVQQQAGYVLSYPSETYHEVTQVTKGVRLSLANFFGVRHD